MMSARVLVFIALGVILGVPFVLSLGRSAERPPEDAETLIIITPHVPQIRAEFRRAFDEWHRREHGTPVRVDFRTPGGTSEIRRQLEAQYGAVLSDGRYRAERLPDGGVEIHMDPGTISFDLMFGGGSYDHGQLARGVRASVLVDGERVETWVPMSAPAGFDQDRLDAWFGENRIGAQRLYDPGQYWLGTALSSFGIVFNRDLLRELGLPEPDSFRSLTDPRLSGWVALADPRQSGSITTTFDSILGYYGWDEGWRILRAMSGNTRYFTNSATKPPIDVSQGEAAVGLAIDFYGRGQAQVVGGGRVGYADPAGAVYVDADPISILRGGPNPELARRFVEFCLTEEAQALWQFRRVGEADNPVGPDGRPMGPRRYELRRMPVRRLMYERHLDHFVDRVNPFEIASEVDNPGWRAGVQIMMGCFAIDVADEIRAAWAALARAGADPGFPPEVLAEMERLFYAFPEHEFPDGRRLAFTEANFGAIRDAWRDPAVRTRSRIAYARFFRDNYRRVVALEREHRSAGRLGAGGF